MQELEAADLTASETTLRQLAAAGTRAPSGDNTQPWRMVVDSEASTVEFVIDELRDPSPMNSGQRMSRIAVGAVVETAVQTADANGVEVSVDVRPDGGSASLRIKNAAAGGFSVPDFIRKRTVNRRIYQSRGVDPATIASLQSELADTNRIRTLCVTAPAAIAAFAEIVSDADALMFGNRTIRAAFMQNVRFDAPANEEVDEGLSLASLELHGAELAAFRMLRRLPQWLLPSKQVGGTFAKQTKLLVESAAGILLGVARDDENETDFAVGRSMQQGWLALTRYGLAAQPMMSLPVLDNIMRHCEPELQSQLGVDHVDDLKRRLGSLLPELGDARPAFLLRFGYADPPSGRCGRRRLEDVVKRREAVGAAEA